MSVVVDPRMAARRRAVRELGARHRLRWVVAVGAAAAVAAALYWMVHSPFLSVRTIDISGTDPGHAAAIAEAAGLSTGDPMLFVPSGAIEDALVADPWVHEARVSVRWPHTVEITVRLHEPVAWVGLGDHWAHAAAGGAVVATAAEPPPWEPRVAISTAASPGAAVADANALAALQFVAALPEHLARIAQLRMEADQLWAEIGAHTVRLGHAAEMTEKAAVVAAIVAAGIEPGTTIDVLTPSRPAVRPPPPVISEDEVEG